MKKGQITMFIVLGIVIVFSIMAALYFSGMISDIQKTREAVEASKALQSSQDVQNFVEDCLLETTKNVLPIVFRNGGYFVLPEKNVLYQHYDIPLYMDEGNEIPQSLKGIERQTAYGIDSTLLSCLAGFAGYDNVEIKGQSKSFVSINDKKVIVETDLPLVIGDEVTSKLSRFYVEYPINLVEVYDEAIVVFKEVKDYKGTVPISRLAQLAEAKDYDFASDNVGEVQLYILEFNKTLIKEQPVEYSFAVFNPLKEGEPIIDGEDDFSEFFGLFFGEAEETEEESFEDFEPTDAIPLPDYPEGEIPPEDPELSQEGAQSFANTPEELA